jgi:hypothetical protein
MRYLLAVGVVLCVTQAFADDRDDWRDIDVVVDQSDLTRQTQTALQHINDAILRTSKRDRQMQALLQKARIELERIRVTVETAPRARGGRRGDRDRDRDRDRDDRDDRRREGVEVQQQVQPPPPPPQPVVYPIAPPQFGALRRAIRAESFSANKLRVLEQAVTAHYFLVAQVSEVIADFDFSQDKLQAARLMRPRILDPENKFKLYESFTFGNDKEELKRILGQ